MAANEKEIEAQTAIAKRNNELELAKSQLKAEADKAAADAQAAGMIQTNLRAREVKESEADAEIAKQKKMVDLAAQEQRSSSASWTPRYASRPMPSFTAARRRPKRKSMSRARRRGCKVRQAAGAEGIALVGRAEPRLSARRVWLRPRR